jgi:transcriptional repressor NrdR
MICIKCFHEKTEVTNSRPTKKDHQVWRRRRCESCRVTFTTREKVDYAGVIRVYKERPMPYDKAKLTISLLRVFDTTGLSGSDAYWICETVEEKLIRHLHDNPGDSGVTPYLIIEIVYRTLKGYHPVAALAYGTAHGIVMPTNRRRRGRPSLD